MTPQQSIERRMAALFILALGLIAWQAPRTRPLVPPWYVSVLKPGEQVFPVAVPAGAPPRLPGDPAARRAFLKEHAVEGFAPFPTNACEGFVRMSAHHWLRVPVTRGAPSAPIEAAGLLPAGAGPGVEVFCGP
jgi:hypothetical protein